MVSEYRTPVGEPHVVLIDLIKRVARKEIQATQQTIQFATVVDENTIVPDLLGYELYSNDFDFVTLDKKPLVADERVLMVTLDRGTVLVLGGWTTYFVVDSIADADQSTTLAPSERAVKEQLDDLQSQITSLEERVETLETP